MTKENKPNLLKNFVYLLLIVLLCVGIYFIYGSSGKVGKEISYTNFQNYVTNGEITHVYAVGTKVYALTNDAFMVEKKVNGVITKEQVTDKVKKEIEEAFFKNGKYAIYYTESPSYVIVEDFITEHNKNAQMKVNANYVAEKEPFIWTIMPYLSFLLLGVLAFIVVKSVSQTNSKNIDFGKSKTSTAVSKVKFSDVAGADEEKQELKELVDYLKDPRKFIEIGAKTPKGVLLVGPPGTGKTLLAKAVAGESNAPFYSISGSNFVEMFVGVGASRVRDLFDKAKQHMPSIIFIDEIDAVGRQRGAGLGGGNDEREQTLNQLLVELDGFEQTDGVIVIAATNRPDVLDPALLRPGRFDRQIYVNLPDMKGREEILKVHARNKKFANDVDFKTIAKITSGFSGADLSNLLNEAAILTARDDRHSITMIDITEAINKVVIGPQKRSHIITDKDKKITAYHESGHAILHKVLPNCDEVQEVSIIPRGMAGGYTMSRPENDEAYATFNKLNDEIAAFMGGRIAEEIIFGDISTGASNDIKQATKIAKKMVTQYGMSSLGFINFDADSEVFIGRSYQTQTSYSEKTASMIDEEIKKIIDNNYNRAKEILTSNIDKLESMAKLLIEKETIYTEQVNMIMNNVEIEKIIKTIDDKIEADKQRIKEEKERYKEKEIKDKDDFREKLLKELEARGCGIKIVKNDSNESQIQVDEENQQKEEIEEKTTDNQNNIKEENELKQDEQEQNEIDDKSSKE